jgi:cytochrome c5
MRKWISPLAMAGAAFVIGGAMAGAQTPPAAVTGAVTPPAGEGLELIKERCRYCHAPAQIFAKKHSVDEWGALMQIMVDRGAEVSPEESKVILDYLTTNFAAQ